TTTRSCNTARSSRPTPATAKPAPTWPRQRSAKAGERARRGRWWGFVTLPSGGGGRREVEERDDAPPAENVSSYHRRWRRLRRQRERRVAALGVGAVAVGDPEHGAVGVGAGGGAHA